MSTQTTTTTTGPHSTISTGANPSQQSTPASRTMSQQPQQGQYVAEADHAKQHEMGHGYGESREEHLRHSNTMPVKHWGLSAKYEEWLFYCFAVPSWCLNIASGE